MVLGMVSGAAAVPLQGQPRSYGVTVTAENPLTGERHMATSALLTFVAINREGGKLPVPPLLLESEAERSAAKEAVARRGERIARKSASHNWQRVFPESKPG